MVGWTYTASPTTRSDTALTDSSGLTVGSTWTDFHEYFSALAKQCDLPTTVHTQEGILVDLDNPKRSILPGCVPGDTVPKLDPSSLVVIELRAGRDTTQIGD
jgi:hypothetical protein